MNNLAVVVIDLYEEQYYGKTIMDHVDDVLMVAHDQRVPVIAVDFPEEGHCTERVSRYAETILHKNTFDAFESTDLETELYDRDVNDIIILGAYVGFCVYQSAKSALLRGYGVHSCSEILFPWARIQNPGGTTWMDEFYGPQVKMYDFPDLLRLLYT